MNLILLDDCDFIVNNDCKNDKVELTDQRFTHIRRVHKAEIGQTLKVGKVNGQMGTGQVVSIDDTSVIIAPVFDTAPPLPLKLTLIIALPRPKMLKRILQTIASLGVKNVYFINSYKVDKSYWSTPILKEDAIRENILLGLEQSVDTILPTVHLRKRFKPFVEDELSNISYQHRKLVAHPYQSLTCPTESAEQTTLIIGPEGGFIDYEIDKLQQLGFQTISLGSRILRVETAIPVAISKLCSL